jgi:energy-coupling factor transport system permease protein
MKLDPRVSLGLVFSWGIAGLCLEGPLPLGILALLPVMTLLLQSRTAAWRGRIFVGIIVLLWSTLLSQGLFWAGWPRTPLLAVGPLRLYREGVEHGLVQGLRFVAGLAAGGLLAATTAPDRLVQALLALRLPFGLALMASTALRFVPLVAEEWAVIRQARAARGRPLWRRSPWRWLQAELELLAPLSARALRRAQVLAETLDCRGFHPTAPRRARVPLQFRRPDLLVLSCILPALSLLVGARFLYSLYRWELYYHPSLRPLYSWVRHWM